MNLFYNGEDITNDVDISSAVYADRAASVADSVSLIFNDPENVWPTWEPQPQVDTIRLWHDGLDTGSMLIDMLGGSKGRFELGGVAIPQAARGGDFRVWEEIRFSELLKEFADRWGLTLQTVDIPDPVYQRIEQNGTPGLSWLAARCMIESCILKIVGSVLVVFYAPAMEARDSVAEISLSDRLVWSYRYHAHLLCSGARVVSGQIVGEFSAPDSAIGPIVPRNDIPALSYGEAQRYAKGIARAHNARAHALTIALPLSAQHTAGQMVTVNAWGASLNGRWFIHEVQRAYIEETMTLFLRRPLEGY